MHTDSNFSVLKYTKHSTTWTLVSWKNHLKRGKTIELKAIAISWIWIFLEETKLSLVLKSLTFYGSKIWNSLPVRLKTAENLHALNQKVKWRFMQLHCLGLFYPPHFVYDFSRKIFLLKGKISFHFFTSWGIGKYAYCSYLFLGLWRINFEINLAFLSSRFSTLPKKSGQKFKYLRTKRAFKLT